MKFSFSFNTECYWYVFLFIEHGIESMIIEVVPIVLFQRLKIILSNVLETIIVYFRVQIHLDGLSSSSEAGALLHLLQHALVLDF